MEKSLFLLFNEKYSSAVLIALTGSAMLITDGNASSAADTCFIPTALANMEKIQRGTLMLSSSLYSFLLPCGAIRFLVSASTHGILLIPSTGTGDPEFLNGYAN